MQRIDDHTTERDIEDMLCFLVSNGNTSDLKTLLESGIKVRRNLSTSLIEISAERNDEELIKILVEHRKYPITKEESNLIKQWEYFHKSEGCNSDLLSLLDENIYDWNKSNGKIQT